MPQLSIPNVNFIFFHGWNCVPYIVYPHLIISYKLTLSTSNYEAWKNNIHDVMGRKRDVPMIDW